METDSKGMICEEDYFFDINLKNCIPCLEVCDPYRLATEDECQIHCSAYLHKKNQLTTADNDSAVAPNSEQFVLHAVVIVLGVLCASVVICVVLACVLWIKCRKTGKNVEKSVGTDFEREPLDFCEVQTSLYSPSKLVSSSLCQYSSVSDRKGSIISFESFPQKTSIPISTKSMSMVQETQAEYIESRNFPDVHPRPKETPAVDSQVPDSVAMQLPNELTCSPIDLQEDFDCVEQTCELAPREHGANAVLSDFLCDTNGTKYLRISAVLQRLAWVRQFWWDVEGAKVVVDASHQSTAKADIKKVLNREGIPSSEFDFHVV